MTMPADLSDLKEGDVIDPRTITPTKEQIEKYSSPPTGNTKRQKKILCIVLTAVKGAMPTIIAKPKKVKYNSRWFSVNGCTYFINKKALIDVGKHYLYMTTEDNAVGACYLAEHQEFAESNQVELMTNQHAVEVFKKHKGIPLKLLLIIGVIAMIAIMIVAITVINLIGMNQQIVNLKAQNTNLITENTSLKQQISSMDGGVIQ
jgi:cell division protein FtsB